MGADMIKFLKNVADSFRRKGMSIYVSNKAVTISQTAIEGRNAYKKNGFLARCINAVADAVASVPLKVYREIVVDGEAEREEVLVGELVDLLATPHPQMTARQFWRAHEIEYGLMGNSIWYFPDEYGGKRINLLDTDEITVIETADGFGIDHYVRNAKGVQTQIDVEQVIHFRNDNPYQKWIGLAVTEILVSPILSSYFIREWNNKFFANNAVPSGILTTDQTLDMTKADQIKERWKSKYGGVEKFHDIAVLGAGYKFEKISESPKDMAFIDLFKIDREEIMAVTGVPPGVAGIMEYANYANFEAQIRLFWELTVSHCLARNESLINEMLIPRLWPANGWYVEYDTSDVKPLQQDATALAARHQIYVNTGILTVNEIRREMNLDAVAWGDDPPRQSSPFDGLLSGDAPHRFKALDRKDDPEVEKRRALWKAFDRKLTMRSSRFETVMRGYFIDQKKRLLAAIQDRIKSVKDPVRPLSVDDIMALFVDAVEMLKMQELTEPMITNVLHTAGKEALKKIGVDAAFNLLDPRVVKWLEQKVLNLVTLTTTTSKEQLRAMLIDGIERGATIQEISKEIGTLFDGFADYRSTRIARTEVISAHNNGALEGYRQSEVVEGKEWLATFDDVTRESHAEMDGQVVALDAPFNVNGWLMQSPGDPAGPAEEVINCRCTILPVMKEISE
jgi:HK97 family phage portal protein